jgi:flavin-dependent dehydrogenase
MTSINESTNGHDVIVIGGGPSGAALATFLRRRGHDCLVLERQVFPRYHIGESLIPHTFGTLQRLGLLPALRASTFPEKHSVRFVPESGDDAEPFYFSETIPGEGSRTWQVERSEFDRMCLDLARESGVQVEEGVRVGRVVFEGDRAVGVAARWPDGTDREIRARVIVDSSGRATLIGRQLDLRGPVPDLHKASIWGYYRGGLRLEGIDAGETTVFMLPERGWFWYIPLPDDVISVGIVDAPERLLGNGRDSNETQAKTFEDRVARCAPLAERLRGAKRIGKVRGIPELAYRNREVTGDGWVMIGDAMMFLDPIYSSGLFLALASAELAADSVHEALDADDVSGARLGGFVAPLGAGVDVIHRLIHAFYDPQFSFGQFVKRFPEHRRALIDCLVGDVVGKNLDSFTEALGEMAAPPSSG